MCVDLCLKVQPTNVLSQDELLSLFTYSAAPEEAKPKIGFATKEREGGGNKIQIHDFNWSQKLSNTARVRVEVCADCFPLCSVLLCTHIHLSVIRLLSSAYPNLITGSEIGVDCPDLQS
jgi:hypothetical protein